MNFKHLVDRIAADTRYPKTVIRNIMNSFVKTIKDLQPGQEFKLKNFGSIKRVAVKGGRVIKLNNRIIKTKPYSKIVVKPSKNLRIYKRQKGNIKEI